MTPSTVCFGAKDDSYGIFTTAISGNITTFKLTYQHGHVSCHAPDPSYQSKWGCLWPPLIPNQMATLITDNDRNLLTITDQILGAVRFTACLGSQPNRQNCSSITFLSH